VSCQHLFRSGGVDVSPASPLCPRLVVCCLEVDKAYVDFFGILKGILKILLESKNLVCNATEGTKTALGIIQVWFNYFAASFSRHLAT